MPDLKSLLALLLLFAGMSWCTVAAAGEPVRVVLVGGSKSEGPGRHEYAQVLARLKSWIENAGPATDGFEVDSYPDGWPADPAALAGAATVVWYFDGLDKHPLRSAAQRAQWQQLMDRGVGLVALHQASTVPPGDDLQLPAWLGAARVGLFDRSTEWTTLEPVAPAHPLSRGLAAFDYRDEFYPTLAFAPRAQPILAAKLHVQYRDGAPVIAETAEQATVAWAFEREGGGRSFGFSGMHYQDSLKQPMLRRLLLNAVLWTAGREVPDTLPVEVATFHGDRGRSGWHRRETTLTPANVAGPGFGLLWESPQLDSVEEAAPRLYASPLYVPRLLVTDGPHRSVEFSAVIAASSNGYVYAVNTSSNGDVAPGRILWRTRLGVPCKLQPAPLDGVPTGILSTPVIDLSRGRLYVTHCDPANRWQAYALDLGSGALLPGWPVRLDEESFNAINSNAGPQRVPPRRRFDFRVQRGALNLSPDGSQLYIVFGETETGWLVSVDTATAKLSGAFAAVAMPNRGSGGIWGAGGPAVDAEGNVFVVTGSGFGGHLDQAHDWTQSLLMLSPPQGSRFSLRGTYTPFNYCDTAAMDIDLGSGGALLLPDLPGAAATPRLLALAGKQGNVYLLDRERLPGRLDRRQPCSTDSSSDQSLLSPEVQAQFGKPGPLNVFGPYSEKDAALDLARARSVPASFRDAAGVTHLVVTGNTKLAEGSAISVAPSVARLRIVGAAGSPAFLQLDKSNDSLVFGNPGSPVISSNGPDHAIAWVLDENAPRSAALAGADAPRPVLYALDARTLDLLWRSDPGSLHTSGKYNEPGFGGGMVFVGTDRIQGFGLGASPSRTSKPPAASSGPPAAKPVRTVAADTSAASIYASRCAACHDNAQGNIPPREVIAAHPRQRIVDALDAGAMRAQAQGLSQEQIQSLARYLQQ